MKHGHGCFSETVTGRLVGTEGRINKDEYTEVFHEVLIPSDWVKVHPLARPQPEANGQKNTGETLGQISDVLLWPSQSLDLNPMEHLADY